jgi:hypothetical protein
VPAEIIIDRLAGVFADFKAHGPPSFHLADARALHSIILGAMSSTLRHEIAAMQLAVDGRLKSARSGSGASRRIVRASDCFFGIQMLVGRQPYPPIIPLACDCDGAGLDMTHCVQGSPLLAALLEQSTAIHFISRVLRNRRTSGRLPGTPKAPPLPAIAPPA